MNKTLTIAIYQDPSIHLQNFFTSWQEIGHYQQISEDCFELISNDEKVSQLQMSEKEITISGELPSRSFMFIDTLARACEADKILEGEVLGKNHNPFTANNTSGNPFSGNPNAQINFQMPLGMKSMLKISTLSKTKLIILMLLALPLLLLMLPIVFLVGIYKVIRFKLHI